MPKMAFRPSPGPHAKLIACLRESRVRTVKRDCRFRWLDNASSKEKAGYYPDIWFKNLNPCMG